MLSGSLHSHSIEYESRNSYGYPVLLRQFVLVGDVGERAKNKKDKVEKAGVLSLLVEIG